MEKNLIHIFDFDGTILKSNHIKTDAYRHIFEINFNTSHQKMERIITYHKATPGQVRRQKIEYICSNILKLDISESDLDLLCNQYSDYVIEKSIKVTMVAGAKKYLDVIGSKNSYIVSAAPRDEIIHICNHKKIESYFKNIFGNEKSKNRHITYIYRLENVQKKHIVYYGDRMKDYFEAKKSGVNFIGINFTDNGHNPKYHFDSFEDFNQLAPLIKSIFF